MVKEMERLTMINSILLDFGNVLAYPSSGNWFVPPNIHSILSMDVCDLLVKEMKNITSAFQEAYKLINENHLMHTEQEEIEQFTDFYRIILQNIDFGSKENIDINWVSRQLAKDLVCNDNRVVIYDDVLTSIKNLKETYRVALLTDNWPSVRRVLDNSFITPLLDGLIISCDYGMCKDKVEFFHIAATELRMEPANTVFVDDSEGNLDNSKLAGFYPIMMDRNNKLQSKYPVIHSLVEVQNMINRITI